METFHINGGSKFKRYIQKIFGQKHCFLIRGHSFITQGFFSLLLAMQLPSLVIKDKGFTT